MNTKILVLGTRGFPNTQGGVEKHCEELYPRLAKLGCEITVLARSPYFLKQNRAAEWEGVKFKYIWCPRKKSIEALVHTFFGVIYARLKSPDILHVHAVGPSLLVPLAKMLGLKVIMTHHGPDYEREKWGKAAKMVLRLGEYFGVKFADRIIAISNLIKTGLEKKFERKDVVLIANGVNIPDFAFGGETLKKYGLFSGRYIFTACRFVPEKGLHDLINAYKSLTNPKFKLVIAGGADHETEYSRNLIKKAEAAEVTLTGFISGRPLAELYSNAGLFVLPSYYEGLPIALLEAMSYNLPVLVSDIEANKEVPIPSFRFFKASDANELAAKIEELFKAGISEEEKLNQKLTLVRDYDWDVISKQTKTVYENMRR